MDNHAFLRTDDVRGVGGAGTMIRVGTSGFSYQHWSGVFYPTDIPQRRWLEFRDPRWYVQEVYSLLEEKKAALCVHDMPKSRCPQILVGPLLYLRFHGPGGGYRGNYPDEILRENAGWSKHTRARDIYAFFNNDMGGHAVHNALTLRNFLQS